jgi:hypothetical protein
MLLIQRGRRRVVAVALLGDGERHDLHGGLAQRVQQRLGVLGRNEDILDGADDLKVLAVRAADGECVEPVLRFHLVADRRGAQACADDAPARVARIQGGLRVDGLMGALERANAEMHDPGRDSAPVVTGARDVVR